MVRERAMIREEERGKVRQETLLELLQVFNDYEVPLTMTAEDVRIIIENIINNNHD